MSGAWTRVPEVLWRVTMDELLLHLPDGTVLSANASAAEVWRALEVPREAAGIAADLAAEHGMDAGDVRGVVDAALVLLEQRGVVTRVGGVDRG